MHNDRFALCDVSSTFAESLIVANDSSSAARIVGSSKRHAKTISPLESVPSCYLLSIINRRRVGPAAKSEMHRRLDTSNTRR